MLVYDVGSRASFDKIRLLHHDVAHIQQHQPGPPIILVGNKSDAHTRAVTTEEGAGLAKVLGCSFTETSAWTGRNVEVAFEGLIRTMCTNGASTALFPSCAKCSCTVL